MPHKFKQSRRTSRSHALLCSSRSNYPLISSTPPHRSVPSDMAYATPRIAKQRDGVIYAKDAKQSSEQNKRGWNNEIDDKIWTIMIPVTEFLDKLVPCNKTPPALKAQNPFNVPTGRDEASMYEPLCEGLSKLVEDFDCEKRPCFRNNAHEEIKFPFLLGEQHHHATKPDVVASLPGVRFDNKQLDRWRDISVVFEAKATEAGDPMKFRSDLHDETLVQLSKSARNILVAQSRLFSFAVGIYGSLARIFRFDHAGALCSQPFEYAADNGAILYEFLWRLVHPIPEGCDIVGADPTVRLITSSADRDEATRQLHGAGIALISNEMKKACRYFTVKRNSGKPVTRYLAYELLFMNPRLFSRATTIWKAVELDARDNPTETHVVIKDAWRQLARKSEANHYAKIYDHFVAKLMERLGMGEGAQGTSVGAQSKSMGAEAGTTGSPSARANRLGKNRSVLSTEEIMEAWEREWPGLSRCSLANDLGEDELRDGTTIGHQTDTGIFHAYGHHRWYERSHMRLVSHTVGRPISQFRSTKEMVIALRDAIRGHRLAFEAGIMHRDVSEGNIMLVNGRGFLHDLDYGFDWKEFLFDLGYEDTMESWEQFVATEQGVLRAGADNARPPTRMPPPSEYYDTGSAAPPRAVYIKGQLQWPVEKILAERNVDKRMEYLLKWVGYGDDENTWEPERHLRGRDVLVKWTQLSKKRREELSLPFLDSMNSDLRAGGQSGAKAAQEKPTAKTMMECKQRTGTFYFMSIEVLRDKVIHEVRHDLESFFWLLLWIVFRYTDHRGNAHMWLRDLFDGDSDEQCANSKRGFLGRGWDVPGNEPLSRLVKKFSKLCVGNSKADPTDEEEELACPLTYDAVLNLFEEAIARDDWPIDDKAIPFMPAVDRNAEHVARLSTAWMSSRASQADSGQNRAAEQRTHASFPPELRNHPFVTRQSAGNGIVMHAGRQSATEPRTPRTTSSGSKAPSVEPPKFRRYVPNPNSPSPSVRRQMMPPPMSPRFSSPLPDIGPLDFGPGRVDPQDDEQDMPPPLLPRVRSQSVDSTSRVRDESSGSSHNGRRKRSHGEYATDAGDSRESSSSSKRARTRSVPRMAAPSTHRMELRKRSGSGSRK